MSTDSLPMTAELLIKHHPKLPTFHLLPKIYKFNIPGRPIVSACSCPTEHISEHLDAILQPLVQSLPTYVKSSAHTLNLIEDINQNPNFELKYFFTVGVTLPYTCIPHSDGLKALKHFLNKRATPDPTDRHLDPSCGTGFEQEHFFSFRDEVFSQVDFEEKAEEMVNFFLQRRYLENTAKKALDQVRPIPRQKSLQSNSNKTAAEERPIMSPIYHPSTIRVRKIILSNWSLLQARTEVAKIFN